jgi:ABC-type amino acid transport substrate-binding protein
VGVVTGTTSLTALKDYLAKNLSDAKVVEVPTREEAMKQLQAKQINAYAGDQIVQIGFLMQAPDPGVYKLSKDLFSYEPYALVVRRNDADFRVVADRALAQIYRSGQSSSPRAIIRQGRVPPLAVPPPCTRSGRCQNDWKGQSTLTSCTAINGCAGDARPSARMT